MFVMPARKNMTLGPAKYEKAARAGRNSNISGLQEYEVRSSPWYHRAANFLLTPGPYVNDYKGA